DRARARGRSDVRDRRSAEQLDEFDVAEDSGDRRYPDSRPAVQEQGCAEGSDRAGRDDHAAHSSPELLGRDDHSAAPGGAVYGAAAAEENVRRAAARVWQTGSDD